MRGRRRRRRRNAPLRYRDGFRGGVAALATAAIAAVSLLAGDLTRLDSSDAVALPALCAGLSLSFLIYVAWTHVVFAGAPAEEVRRIAAEQHGRGAGALAKLLGLGSAESIAMSAAAAALAVALAASVLGVGGEGSSAWLALLVVATAATAWALVAYSFALRYFRQHAAGDRFTFDFEEEPQFTDFLSMAVMISAAGAMSGGTPRSRSGLAVVRAHTLIAFVFNALVVAATVSLLVGLISTPRA